MPTYTGELANRQLQETIENLKLLSVDSNFNLFAWDEHHIAVGLSILVDLPPLGNAGGIDIRMEEPVLVVFDLEQYPGVAPKVYPDRLDFPKDRLPHLYVAKWDKPPRLCLTRGPGEGWDEWYSHKRIEDVIIRTRNWLRDAAAGELAVDGEQFEPLRLEGYSGSFTYDYAELERIVREKEGYDPGGNFARFRMERFSQKTDNLDMRYDQKITPETMTDLLSEMIKEDKKEESDPTKRILFQGFCVWAENEKPFNHYQVKLPVNWAEFIAFSKEFGIETTGLEKEIAGNNLSLYRGIAIIVALKRPHPIIGFTGQIEFLNFMLLLPEDHSGNTISSDATMNFSRHIQPMTVNKVRDISGFCPGDIDLAVFAGCGALSSRVALHLMKAGLNSSILFDPDTLEPHNLVRHPLSVKYIGRNKAKALAAEIRAAFEYQLVAGIPKAIQNKDLQLLKSGIVLDFTATTSFLNLRVNTQINSGVKVIRGLLSDKGNLGLLYVEGYHHNPRLDDLAVLTYNQAFENPVIADWLKREAEETDKTVTISTGVGCGSETVVLAEDIIAVHAAFMSGNIKVLSNSPAMPQGSVYLSMINKEGALLGSQLSLLRFEPLDTLPMVNNTDWTVRFANGILSGLKEEMSRAGRQETGGVMIGCANYKTKAIHVTRVLPAPSDSRANPVCFFRGKEGLPEAIKKVTETTGGQLGYIGEWHSHPDGPEGMSMTDIDTVSRFAQEFHSLNPPLPVFLLIITPNNILPFIF